MDILIKLLLAHVITDFFFQPDEWVEDKHIKKQKSVYLYFHVLIVTLVSWLLLFEWAYWWIAVIILVSHFTIDLIKLKWGNNDVWSFILDQFAHFIVIIICSFIAYQDSISYSEMINQYWTTNHLIYLLAYLLVTIPVGYFVGIATQRWRDDLMKEGNDTNGLAKAGMWIGIIERLLVLTFVLLQQFGAIGFLIAAKSILRFSDKGDYNPRKQTEYVLIGTLSSFAIALFIGLTVLYLSKILSSAQ